MTAPDIRPDSALLDFDVDSAVAAGMRSEGPARRRMLGDAAVAAALRADALGIDPNGVRFLAQYVRSAGRAAAATLPEPLVGEPATALAGGWLRAADDESAAEHPGSNGAVAATPVAADDLFAQWLLNVAAILELRRRTERRP